MQELETEIAQCTPDAPATTPTPDSDVFAPDAEASDESGLQGPIYPLDEIRGVLRTPECMWPKAPFQKAEAIG